MDTHLLARRIEHLEEAGRHTLEALEMAARLGDFNRGKNDLATPTAILAETCQRISQLMRFKGMSMYLVNELTLEFEKHYESDPIYGGELDREFERLTENKTIAWALQRKKHTFAPSEQGHDSVLIHSVATNNKTMGLFLGILDEDVKTVMDSSLSVLSIILLNSANTLENLQLLKLNREANKKLAVKIAQLREQVASRERAEAELEKTRHFLDRVINTVPDPLMVKDANHRLIMVNDAFCLAMELPRETLLGKTQHDLLPRNDANALQRTDALVLNTGKDHVIEFDMAKPGKRVSTFSIKTALLSHPDTGESILVSVLRDITEQKMAERMIRAERERFLSLLEELPATVYVLNMDHTIDYANRRFREIYGDPQDKNCFELFRGAGPTAPCRNCPASEMLASGTPRIHEKDVGESVYQFYDYPFTDTDGTRRLLSMGIDVTEQKKATRTLQQAKEEAELASRSKTEFLANMSHEIRTPLNGVLGMLQLCSSTELNEDQRDYVETALESGRSLLTVINDVLDLSKIEAGKFEIEKTRFEPRELLRTVIQTFAHNARNCGVQLDYSVGEGVPEVAMGDGGRIRQILFNLVGNSMKFTPKGFVHASVSILPGPDNGTARLLFTVEDSGIGIPDDRIDHAFEAFTQVDGSYRRKYGGTGLGLGIVRRLLDLMNGSISLNTEEGRGTTICFRLDVGLPPDSCVRRNTGEGSACALPENMQVLVVEDNRVNRIMARRILEQNGVTVHCAESGEQALQKLQDTDMGCVLMDIQMPGMDGMEAAQRIRNGETGEANRNIPIIALTAHAMEGDRERFVRAGMNAYIPKPFEMDTLMRVMNRVLSKPDV
jgi:PAS domain S-box-containing protein